MGHPRSRLTWRVSDTSVLPKIAPAYQSSDSPAWMSSTGRGARVCVIDSGIEAGHPLIGEVSSSYVVVGEPDDRRLEETAHHDSAGHGTACAGVIRAVAPEAELVSVRVLHGFSGGTSALLAGLAWAIDEGFDVVNLSLSTKNARAIDPLRKMVEDAYFKNVLLVCSAHNMAIESFPWRFSSVISVGSHPECDRSIHFYNPRPPVEFLAAGQDIEVAWVGGATRRVSGNSFATPHISGLCARIRAAHPDATPFEVKSMLRSEAANARQQ